MATGHKNVKVFRDGETFKDMATCAGSLIICTNMSVYKFDGIDFVELTTLQERE